MPPKEIKATFVERVRRTQTVESFSFLPLEKLDFMPGQFLQFIFDQSKRDNLRLNKYLSFSSSPAREYVEVTKRLSDSEFSQRLRGLKVGDEVVLMAPLGHCIFEDSYKRIGFLIGGIGITPVISILGYIMDKKLDTDIWLLYSNRNEEEIAFKQEIDSWQASNSKMRTLYAVTDCPPRDKRCFFGCIDKNLLLNNVSDLKERVFFIFGPPKMVQEMAQLCFEAGCKKENIKTESFLGY